MKRYAFPMLICLLLGVATTYGVAWGIELFTKPGWDFSSHTTLVSRYELELDGFYWRVFYRNEKPGCLSLHTREFVVNAVDSIVITQEPVRVQPNDSQHLPPWSRLNEEGRLIFDRVNEDLFLAEEARGWPFLALYTSQYLETPALSSSKSSAPNQGTVYSVMWDINPDTGFATGGINVNVFPLQPIWKGFIFNTLFYTAIWIGFLFFFTSLKHRLRVIKGRCPKCAYDLRSDLTSGCPECGWNR